MSPLANDCTPYPVRAGICWRARIFAALRAFPYPYWVAVTGRGAARVRIWRGSAVRGSNGVYGCANLGRLRWAVFATEAKAKMHL